MRVKHSARATGRTRAVTTGSGNAAKGGTLVVGYDGRDESERALSYAIDEAASNGERVVVLVVEPLHYEPVDPYGVSMTGVGFMGPIPDSIGLGEPIPDAGPADIQPLLSQARDRLAKADVQGDVEWALGDPVSELVRVAAERDARALVVGTHHHSALGRLFGTDIAAELIRAAGCDVIVAR